MSNEPNTKLMERFYDLVDENHDLSEEQILKMDLEDAFEYILNSDNKRLKNER